MIYFITTKQLEKVKIGYTEDLYERRTALQVGNSEKLLIIFLAAGDRETEASLHERFSADKLSGDWHRLSTAIADYISARRHAHRRMLRSLDLFQYESLKPHLISPRVIGKLRVTSQAKWLDPRSSATYCSCSVETIRRAARSGKLRVAYSGRVIRTTRQWLDDWMMKVASV